LVFQHNGAVESAIPYHRLRAVALPVLRREGHFFQKNRAIQASAAVPGEIVDTITASGCETRNVVGRGDYIVENPTAAGERYVISKDQLHTRYRKVADANGADSQYRPIGFIAAVRAKRLATALQVDSKQLKFIAPWGSVQRILTEDFIVTPWPAQSEVYGIAAAEFAQTYGAINDSFIPSQL